MRYLEDFSPGQRFESGRLRVDRDRTGSGRGGSLKVLSVF
jgi:hypothetical protein